MEKRVLLALALSFIVLGFYPMVIEKLYPGAMKRPAAQQSAAQTAAVRTVTAGPEFAKEKDVVFEDKTVTLLLNSQGGVVRKMSFPEYINSETKKPIELFSHDSLNYTTLSIGISKIPGVFKESAAESQIQKSGDTVTFSSEAVPGKLKLTKRLVFSPDGYSGKLTVDFQNTSQEAQEFYYELALGSSIIPRHSIDTQYIEGDFYYNDGSKKILKHIREYKQGKIVKSPLPVEWASIKDRHFSIVLRPDNHPQFYGTVQGLGNRHFAVSLDSDKITVPAGQNVSHEFTVYMGPNEIDRLLPLGLDALINFGKLDGISKILVGALELLHKVFHNYGLAIIVLTILINVLLFPFTRVSYMSMKRMQLIQPQVNKLKEQYGKNPERLNKETMELYKKHKVNPFSGCLPLVVQMPIFIALYVALSKTVILINSKLLWIHDLSSPDKMPLPVTLPFIGNDIHVLPLVMVAAMAIQQRFTQVKMAGQDPAMEQQQKMMAVMMPVIFGFIFYSMPSGLVLYWLTNTILMTAYQLHLKKVTLT